MAKKIKKCFSGHFYEKQMRQAGFFIYIPPPPPKKNQKKKTKKKTDGATFSFFYLNKT